MNAKTLAPLTLLLVLAWQAGSVAAGADVMGAAAAAGVAASHPEAAGSPEPAAAGAAARPQSPMPRRPPFGAGYEFRRAAASQAPDLGDGPPGTTPQPMGRNVGRHRR